MIKLVEKQEISEVEDLFLPGDYMKLYSNAFPDQTMKLADIPETDETPIVHRIQSKLGKRYNHFKVP